MSSDIIENIDNSFKIKIDCLKTISILLTELDLFKQVRELENEYNLEVFPLLSIENDEFFYDRLSQRNMYGKLEYVFDKIKQNIENNKQKISKNERLTMLINRQINIHNEYLLSERIIKYNIYLCESCKSIMIETENQLVCTMCGHVKNLVGLSSQMIKMPNKSNQNGTNKYYKECMNYIIGKPTDKVPSHIFITLKDRFMREGMKEISCDIIRKYLKKLKGGFSYYKYSPYIRNSIVNETILEPNTEEDNLLSYYFEKILEWHLKLRSKDMRNKIYGFFIYKLIDLLIIDTKKRRLWMEGIHLPKEKTRIRNDLLWMNICKSMSDPKISYKSTMVK